MSRKYPDPEAPEVLEAVLQKFQNMSREEWQAELAWKPAGARETWRTKPATAAAPRVGARRSTAPEPIGD